MSNVAYKFRIYPSTEQKTLFIKIFGCVRFVYNHWLDKKITQYEIDKSSIPYKVCAKELTELKKTEDYAFLKEADGVALQQSLRHLDTAFQNFFKRSKTRFPKFKTKKHIKNSYSTMCNNGNIYLKDNHIKLPKVGLVKIKQHRSIPTNYHLKSATISQTPSGKYYVSILFEYENQVIKKEIINSIGLDFSMKELYIDSNGGCPKYPRYYRLTEDRLKRKQRELSLMNVGSNNQKKQKIKIAKLHEKIANQRKDFLHKQSRQITNAYDLVCIEDLNVQAMSQTLNFGKSVYDNGWRIFVNFLKYKLEEQGKKLIKVDKFFASSQICSCCGYVNKDTKNLAVRAWDCPQCGMHHDRDMNAAINIKNEGIRILFA